jgi:branched-chain amino acid transport system substrate-binding protein
VTRDTITVSVIAGFSGPLAAMVDKAYGGLQTWQSDVNAAGGINGRKVQLIQVDDKETSDGGVAACKEALSNGSYISLIAEGVDANVTAASCLDAAGMPSFGFVGALDPSWKRVFSDSITVPQAGRVMASYVRNVVGGPSRKAGVIYVNQLAYKGLSDTFVPEARRLGLTVADVESVEPNQASFTAELTRLKQAGVQNLVISATAEAIGILRDAKSIGYTPTFTGWGMTFDFMTVAGRNLFAGVTGLRTNATVDTPAFDRYEARMAANGRGTDRSADTEAFVGYGHALVLGEMLRKAGPQPTWDSFVSGAESIRGFDSGVFPPLTFGPGRHVGTQAAFPALCCNSDWTWKHQGLARAEF